MTIETETPHENAFATTEKPIEEIIETIKTTSGDSADFTSEETSGVEQETIADNDTLENSEEGSSGNWIESDSNDITGTAINPASEVSEAIPVIHPTNETFVRVIDYIPSIYVDLKYATSDNFTGEIIYDFNDAYLRFGTVQKLIQAETRLEEYGYCLKIWDAFRPTQAQFRLWEVCPDGRYVANPYNGFSSHSRGNTVDVTCVNSDGTDVPMPTGFDDFSSKADRDYSDCNSIESENARLLESIMRECGFQPYFGEWWHFSDQTVYNVENDFNPSGTDFS